MKSLLALLAALSATTAVTSAASIRVDGFQTTNFVSPIGRVPLGTSFVAKVGFLAYGTVLPPSPDFALINAAWTNAGQANFASGDAIGFDGYVYFEAVFSDALTLAGKDVYVWITDGGELNGILRSLDLDFLNDSAIPNRNDLVIGSDTISKFEFVLGSYDPNGVNESGSGGSIIIVPEPSALLLGALGVAGFIRRRRA